MPRHTLKTLFGALALGMLIACGGGGGASAPAGGGGGNPGGGGPNNPTVGVTVTPPSASMATGTKLLFQAKVTGSTNEKVNWSADAGSIDATGLFTAPSNPGVAHVKATSQADSTAFASVSVDVTAAVQVAITPAKTTLKAGSKQQFSVTLNGAASTAVIWKTTAGSINAQGLFTAPTEAGSATITATSTQDSTKSATATVTVTAATGTVAAKPQLPVLAWRERSDWINVKTSSLLTKKAVGDGVADDTEALNAGLKLISFRSGLPGDPRPVLYLPPGTYKITKRLQYVEGEGSQVIGCGRDTTILWGGPASDPDNPKHTDWKTGLPTSWMFESDGSRDIEYIGIVWDGNGVCNYGYVNSAKAAFENRNFLRMNHFKNFTSAGILSGWLDGYASSEAEFRDCLFENCEIGIRVIGPNYYNYAVTACDFYDCGVAISMTYFAQGYVRRCHFERSRIADLESGDPSFSFSIRNCTSIGSQRFYRTVSSNTNYKMQNNVVEGWGATDGAVTDWIQGSKPFFDMRFLNAPGSFGPLSFTRENQKSLSNRKVLSNVTSSTVKVAEAASYLAQPVTLDRVAPAGQLIRSDVSFRTTTLDVSNPIIDVMARITAAGKPLDHTAIIQKAVDDAKAANNGTIVYFPRGRYNVESTVKVSGGGYSLEGTGMNSTILRDGKATTPYLQVESPQGLSIRGLHVDSLKQIRTTSGGSSVTYDWIFSAHGDPVEGNATQYFWDLSGSRAKVTGTDPKDALIFEGLSSGDVVHMKRINGAIRVTNSARATIYAEWVDGTPIVAETNETVRDGFFGIMNLNGMTIQMRNNHNFVVGDYYTERGYDSQGRYDGQSGNPLYCGILLTGAASDPKGSVVFGQAKFQGADDRLFQVRNYSGQATLFYPYIDTGDRAPGADRTAYTLRHEGTQPLDLLFMGMDTSQYKLEVGSGANVLRFPDSDAGSAAATKAADRLAELCAVDLALNTQATLNAVQTPTMVPAGGSFRGSVKVQVRSATDGASLRYTTDGSEPTSSSKTVTDNGLISVDATQQLRIAAFKSGYADSPSISSDFVIQPAGRAQSVWPDSKKPTKTLNGPEAGAQTFFSTVDGWITAIRVYSLKAESGIHKVRLWSWNGVATINDYTIEAGPLEITYGGTEGWVSIPIAPLRIKRDQLYLISVSAGTDANKVMPTLQYDPEMSVPAGSNGVNLIYPFQSARSNPGEYDLQPSVFGAYKECFLRDVVFMPDEPVPTSAPAAVPVTPEAPAVSADNGPAPTLSGKTEPNATVHVLPRVMISGLADGQVALPIRVKAAADGTWSCTLDLPAGSGDACVIAENAKGLSTVSPVTKFTVKK